MDIQNKQKLNHDTEIEDQKINSGQKENEKGLQKTYSDKTQIIRHDGSSKLEIINIIQNKNIATYPSQKSIDGYQNEQSTINIQDNLHSQAVSKQQVIRVKIEENKPKEQYQQLVPKQITNHKQSPLNVNLDFGDQKFFGNVQQKKKLHLIDRVNKLPSTINNENKKSITKTVSQNEEQDLKKYSLLDKQLEIEETVRYIGGNNLQLQPIQGNKIQLQQRQGISADKLNQIIDELENKIIKNIDQNNQTYQKKSNKNTSQFYETQEIETQVKQLTPQSSTNELLDGLDSLYSKQPFTNQPSIIVIGQKKKDDQLHKTTKQLQKSQDHDNRQLMSQFSKMMSDYKNGQQLTAEEETEKPSSAKIKLS